MEINFVTECMNRYASVLESSRRCMANLHLDLEVDINLSQEDRIECREEMHSINLKNIHDCVDNCNAEQEEYFADDLDKLGSK